MIHYDDGGNKASEQRTETGQDSQATAIRVAALLPPAGIVLAYAAGRIDSSTAVVALLGYVALALGTGWSR